MVNFLTRVYVTDNSGVLSAQCIKLLGYTYIQRATMQLSVIVVVKHSVSKSRKFKKGRIFRALVVRTAFAFFRVQGAWIRFGHSAVIFINRRRAPLTKRILGPMLKELCLNFNFLGTVSNFIF
jgi:large subunit ribosomal protein L14